MTMREFKEQATFALTDAERESLIDQMVDTFGDAGYDPSRDALEEQLAEWEKNKGWIAELFKRHPNYNGKYQITFSHEMSRSFDFETIKKFLNGTRSNVHFTAEQADFKTREKLMTTYIDVIREIQNNISQVISKELADYVSEQMSALQTDKSRFAQEGQKLTKLVGKLCRFFGVDKWEDYNREYAKFADAVNPIKITRHTILSVHPLDYLRMSYGHGGWHSCHDIRDADEPGCYSSGTLSYMMDGSSFVFYTVDAAYDGDNFELQDKINRNMFHMGDERLVQGRCYPQSNDGNLDLYKEFREVVQKVIADCLDEPNLWTNKKGTTACVEVIHEYGTHYPDYRHIDACNVSTLKGQEGGTVCVGHTPICPQCGEIHNSSENCLCYDCRNVGEWCEYHQEYENCEMTYIEGYGDVCEAALDDDEYFFYCDYCREWRRRDDDTIDTEDGHHYCDCEHAMNDGYVCCDNCGEWHRQVDMIYVEDVGEYCSHSCADSAGCVITKHGDWVHKRDARLCEWCGDYVLSDDWDDEIELCSDCAKKAKGKQEEAA